MFDVIEGKKGYKGLRHLVVLDESMDDPEGQKVHAEELGVTLHIFSDVEDLGYTFFFIFLIFIMHHSLFVLVIQYHSAPPSSLLPPFDAT